MGKVWSIDPEQDFAAIAAAHILARAQATQTPLADVRVLLPNRRAVRTMEIAFLRALDREAALMPTMTALADLADTVEGVQFTARFAEGLPPAIDPLERTALLTQMVARFGGPSGTATLAESWRLADALARLLDEAQSEAVDLDRLADLVDDHLAQHWAVTLQFLNIIAQEWPKTLAKLGRVDPVMRRDAAIYALADAWQAATPDTPVFAVGSTGTNRSVRALLTSVRRAAAGEILLPGLDGDMDDESWARVGAGHPQGAMKHLLDTLGVHRAEVERLAPPAPPLRRVSFFFDAFRPAELTDSWRLAPYRGEATAAVLSDLKVLTAPNRRIEAHAIALAMRRILETKGKTAALVTPDRRLAGLVAAALAEWNLTVDDSAGEPAQTSLPGRFLRLVAHAAAARFSPLSLLALLQHPFTACGMARADFLKFVRRLDKDVLRGPPPAAGLAGLRAHISHRLGTAARADEFAHPLARLCSILEPLEAAFAQAGALPVTELLRTHLTACEALATGDGRSGADSLWAREAGNLLADHMHALLHKATTLEVDPAGYAAFFDAAIAGLVVRRPWGQHPRLAILGPIEARLQRADLMILGGLSEGIWPDEPSPDPWLSEPMRLSIGLVSRERRIGQMAHDFVQAASAPEVLLTRAEKVDGSPTIASRWLYRLEALLGRKLPVDHDLLRLATVHAEGPDGLQGPVQARPPAPCPAARLRPNELSVTQVETWMRDPYALYAKKILGLVPLEPVNSDPSASVKGTLLHTALERFTQDCSQDGALLTSPGAKAHFIALGREVFSSVATLPTVYAFWWPRFLRLVDAFIAAQKNRSTNFEPVLIEGRGRLAFKDLDFTLTAKADRIDRSFADGHLDIIDYKTGTIATRARMAAGYAPQLQLEALIAEAGGFERLPAGEVRALSFWRVSGGPTPLEIKPVDPKMARALIDDAREGLSRLVTTFQNPDVPYLCTPTGDPALSGWGDYDHLARRAEWAAALGESE